MSDLLNQASLVMIPSGYKEDTVFSQIPTDGTGDLSFTRASNGTRINSAGLVEVCPWNLVRYSEDFSNATWGKVSATITANTTVAPNGTTTADTLVITSGGYLLQQPTISIGVGFAVTISIYAKNQTNNFLLFGGATPAGNDVYTIQDAGNGWYRHINTRTFTASGTSVQFIIYDQVGTNFIWGAQLNIGSTAKPYFPTTDRLNVPRLTYQNGGGGCPSLLLEKQATNYLKWSNDFTQSAWVASASITRTANYATSPDGTQTATRIQWNGTDGELYQYLGVAAPTRSSVYIKGTAGQVVNFCLNQITLTGEWQRIDASSIPDGSNTWFGIITKSSVGHTATDFLLWGGQGEAGSYATSLIFTTSSSATRVADACYKTGISSLIGQTEGTIFVDSVLTHSTTNNEYLIQVSASASNRFFIYREALSNKLGCFALIGSTQIYTQLTSGAITGRVKAAFAYQSGSFAFYVNGTQIGVSTATFSTPPTMDRLDIDSNAGLENGYYNYNEAVLFKTRLTNAELASLTTI